jgi:2-aminoethylphosphonate-pyruvate transaminase
VPARRAGRGLRDRAPRALTNAASRTYYLDLVRLAKLQDQRNTPFTPSVHAYYALVEALREHQEEGGWKGRHQRYAALAEQARAGLAALGIEALWPAEQSSVVLRAYRCRKASRTSSCTTA